MLTQREIYFEHLKDLENELLHMGNMAIEAIRSAYNSYKEGNLELAETIVKEDSKINNKRWEIEEKCISLIATQQPVAKDLRELISILSIIVEIERMGDYAAGIAKIVSLYGNQPHIKQLIDIPRMVEKDIQMIKNSLDSFIRRDIELAKKTWNQDNEIDALYDQIFRELITYMVEDPKNITKATYMIWIAHNLERIADRATNICERIVFLIKGKMERMSEN